MPQPNFSTVNGPKFVPPPKTAFGKDLNFGDPAATSPARDQFIANATTNTPPPAPVNSESTLNSGQPASTNNDAAFESYLSSLRPSSEVTTARRNLGNLTSQGEQAVERATRSGETLSFAAGEASRVGRDANLAINAASRNLEALTGVGQAKRDISKARFDFEQGKIDQARSDTRFDREQSRLEAPDPFTLSPGQTEFDSEGKVIASLPGTPKAPTNPKGTTLSGGLVYTPQAAAEDTQQLEGSRGDDGFVDPNLYQQLYDAWIQSGGLQKDFISKYPPKNHVNPANTFLPAFLMPKKTDTDELINQINSLFPPK